ncbi:DUF7706 family protein [Rhizobium leguminosarum]|uniref:DUF7706 family protein n=1 Tax=Rhizobium leguminosarum TaxID=384 RepID=UPI001030E871|nr:hypothetical protein [Rhizobium leguminosarum]TAW50615.1 hypothetical protein ELI14_04165 [Rhizobium leguminosarum]
MRDIRLDAMFQQVAAKAEELRCGTAPEELIGSPTVRAAAGLIAGISLNSTTFTDKGAWSMLDEVQKRTVVHFRPVSKYAAWLESDLEEKRLREDAETDEQRSFRQYIEWQTETTYCMEFELKSRLAEAIAVLAKRSSVDAMRAFADDDEEALRMARALKEVGSALEKMGITP